MNVTCEPIILHLKTYEMHEITCISKCMTSDIRVFLLEVVEPPTGVNFVSTGKSSGQLTWSPKSKVLLYQVTVSDNDNTSNAPIIRNTSATTMDITNLEPCSTYIVGVSSVNVFLVPGEASNVTHTTSSEYLCKKNSKSTNSKSTNLKRSNELVTFDDSVKIWKYGKYCYYTKYCMMYMLYGLCMNKYIFPLFA